MINPLTTELANNQDVGELTTDEVTLLLGLTKPCQSVTTALDGLYRKGYVDKWAHLTTRGHYAYRAFMENWVTPDEDGSYTP